MADDQSVIDAVVGAVRVNITANALRVEAVAGHAGIAAVALLSELLPLLARPGLRVAVLIIVAQALTISAVRRCDALVAKVLLERIRAVKVTVARQALVVFLAGLAVHLEQGAAVLTVRLKLIEMRRPLPMVLAISTWLVTAHLRLTE